MTTRHRTPSLALHVPDRIVPILGLSAGALLATYITLVIVTIFFASWQTQLASSVEGSRNSIHRLEDQYYAAIAKVDSTDPSSMGLVSPQAVKYVVATPIPGLSFASR